MSERVKWTKANGEGWSGDGLASVLQMDKSRMHFGPKMGTPGPALLLKLEASGQTVWVPPVEVEPA